MDFVDEAQVKAVVQERKVKIWQIGECSMCSYPLAYHFFGDTVGFDPGCDCTRGSGLEARDYADFVEHFNIQTPEVRAVRWAEFISAGEPDGE